jgi:hypothetical protein
MMEVATTLKMATARSSKTLKYTVKTKWRNHPKDYNMK